MDSYPWFRSAKRLLELTFPADRHQVRIADLGCLEGGFSVEFARLGFQVVGVEVRATNFAACAHVKAKTSLPNLTFINDDAWNLGAYGPFDAIFCSGLLYHLDKPKAFLEMLSLQATRLLILHTHFTDSRGSLAEILPRSIRRILAHMPWSRISRSSIRHNLSRRSMNEGLKGRWYTEFESDAQFASREISREASWDNRRSFWVAKEDLLQTIRDIGFDLVAEQFDCLGDDIAAEMYSGYYREHDRGMFIGVKSTAIDGQPSPRAPRD
jgi:SAM-dependent methyltransferase